MPEQPDLIQSGVGEIQQPKYSQWAWQLNRLEILVDQCLNSYTNLHTEAGREKFASALEAFYIALSPYLKKEDREQLRKYKYFIRERVNRLNNAVSSTGATKGVIDALRQQCGSTLEIMILLKDKRGFGIPRKEKEDWKEEFAHALDLQVEEEKKGEDKNGGTKLA